MSIKVQELCSVYRLNFVLCISKDCMCIKRWIELAELLSKQNSRVVDRQTFIHYCELYQVWEQTYHYCDLSRNLWAHALNLEHAQNVLCYLVIDPKGG